MLKLDHKEGWVWKNWCFWIVVLEKALESPFHCKEIKSVNPKGNQPWTFIGRNDAEAEAPLFWPLDVKSWLTGKYPDAEKDWRQKEKEQQRMRWLESIIDSMDMNLNFSKLPRDGVEWRSLSFCSPWTWLSHWATTRTKLEAKNWVLDVFISTEVLLLLGPFSWQSKKIYMWNVTKVLTDLYLYLLPSSCLLHLKWMYTEVSCSNPILHESLYQASL